MGKRKFSTKQRMSILAEHDAGASIADLCRKRQISPATLYNWKKEKAWANANGIELRFIQPGKPSQNSLIERLNKTLRRECLDLTWYHSMSKLNDAIQIWSQTYNLERPHDKLGRIPPDKYEQLHQNFYYSVVAA